ncbi:protein D2-like [Coccinella septempunctata]|uniref:protein D2-like n=1 Tax=Coccinella septempunctata TaxID=41139 RepID=UPI001D07B18E|nr:protein D2-like [Coccinella septempunctata]
MRALVCSAVFAACLISLGFAEDVEKAFSSNEIDKDVIKPLPQKKLQIHYPKTKQIVNLGNELTPKNVRDLPEVTYESDPKAFYTLSMSDPDAPSRKNPTRREFQHWLVVNIPGSDLSKGEVLNEYVGSGPPKGTGLHRYVFLLFKQPGKVDFKEPKHSKTDGNRGGFSVQKFAKKYNLGDAVAGNFFQAQYDDSVPELHKQFKA